MISIDIGEKNYKKANVEALVKKNALMYLSLYPKDLHYMNMNNYLRDKYDITADLYSICYNIIARCRVTYSDKDYKVIISPQDEFLYKLITFGNREIRGISILNNALTILK